MSYTPLEQSIRAQLKLLDNHKPDGKNISALDFYGHAHEFSQREIRPLDDIAYNEDRFPHELWETLGADGMKGVIIPQEHGGMGLGNLELCLATNEVARASGAIAISYVCDQALCSRQIAKHGTPEQQERYLPDLASGKHVGALAMSEPNSGSDVMSMTTRAKRVDGGFTINGSKYWITNGARFDPVTGNNLTADTLVLYAKTDDTDRVTAFIIDSENEGFKAGGIIKKATTRGSDTAEIVFDDCFVPDNAVLGEVGKGAHIMMDGLNAERLVFAANTIGVAQAAFEETNAESMRERFDMPIAYNQSVAFDLADAYSQIEMAQNYILLSALQSDIDPKALTNGAAASVFLQAGNIADIVTNRCQQLNGGTGQTVECRADRQRGVASLLQVGAGSKQMRLRRIAEHIIPGYDQHLKLEDAFRASVVQAAGQPYSSLDKGHAARQIKQGGLQDLAL